MAPNKARIMLTKPAPVKRSQHTKNSLFDILNMVFMFLLMGSIIIPYFYVFMVSITNEILVEHFFSVNTRITFSAYKNVIFANKDFINAFIVSTGRTVIGTFLNILFTCMIAYVLSRRVLPGKNIILTMMVATMFFSGGLIPSYIINSLLKLNDNYLVYILPGLISAWNAIVMRNFFQSIPDALEEAAIMDGASHFRILFSIVIPLSMPAIASISLFYAVSHWNSWFDSIIYMRTTSKYTLQVFLRRLVMENANMQEFTGDTALIQLTPEAIKNASIIVTTLPIVMVYPFLQKYFVKGIMIGAIKS